MKPENPREEKKKKKLFERLKRLIGIDLCSCGTLNVSRCDGVCRKAHTNASGKVVCFELYQIDTSQFKPKKRRKRNED